MRAEEWEVRRTRVLDDPGRVRSCVDRSRAHSARVYDFLLGGTPAKRTPDPWAATGRGRSPMPNCFGGLQFDTCKL